MGITANQFLRIIFYCSRLKDMRTYTAFIQPEEMSSGYKLKRIYDENVGFAVMKSIQTTFQFIPITKTLTSLFSNDDFEETYMNFNIMHDHECGKGIYHNFCCGSVYGSSDFFNANPNAIQIRLFTDDFEPCDPLKSRAGVHKITAFYFQINNFPTRLLSKIDNIYLVALSDACDSKSELTDTQSVVEIIVADLKALELNGTLRENMM